MRRRLRVLVVMGAALLAVPAVSTAAPLTQAAPRGATLRIVVADQTGAVIVGARVTLEQTDPPAAAVEGVTNEQGEATFAGLPAGRFRVRAEFAGFEPGLLADIRLRAGGNLRRELRLAIARIEQDVVVGQDPRDRALDPRGGAFSSVLSKEQIEALPDDPDEMEEALKQMAGPGATIRVDGFQGGRLPPKSQIRSVRFRRDMFAAENHGGGMTFVDVVTSPGGGPLRGSVDVTFRDESLNARNAFAPARAPEQQHGASVTMSGTLVKDRTGFTLTTNGIDAYDSKTLLAATPNGRVSESVRRPNERTSALARIDHALSKSHTMRASYQRNGTRLENLGVGDFDLPSRAYGRETTDDAFRFSLSGPAGRSLFSETRFQARRQSTESRSLTDAPAVVVLDAFSSGGAQTGGGRTAADFELASDLDYAKGRHSARAGFLLEGGRYRSSEIRNQTGTFTFASLADYEAGRPTTFTQRAGDPRVEYSHVQFGWYVQDDIRLSRSLALNLGVRHELQTHVDDAWNVAPRAGVTWSPRRSGATVVRGGGGVFYDWFDAPTYEQTLRVDGIRQTDLVVQNPGFPDPFVGGDVIALPSGRLVRAADLALPRTLRANLAVEQTLGASLRVNAIYSVSRGRRLLRGRNLNAPLEDGARPDPTAGNIIQVESTARSSGQMLHAGLNVSRPWQRLFLFVNYTYARMRNDSDGAFSLPADNFDLAAEWGPSPMDIPHRLTGMFSMNLVKGFKIAANVSVSSGQPYNITTGRDDNGDTVSNDRPAGVGRNSGRTAGRWDVGARLGWAFGFGQRKGADGGAGGPTIVMHRIGGESSMGGFTGGAEDKRWRFELYLAATNVFNHTNPLGYSGVMTSPFFGQPTSAGPPRKLELGARFNF